MEPNAHVSQHDDNDEINSDPLAAIKAQVQRDEERRRELELRRAQMTPEERAADMEKKARARHNKQRKAAKKEDLVEIALTGYLSEEQSAALLRQPFPPDATAFLRSLNGYLDTLGDIEVYRRMLGESIEDAKPFLLRSPELCKFALVDWRVPNSERIQERGPSLALDRLYKILLKEQGQDDRLDHVRAVARGHPMQRNLKRVQYWARKMLNEYEAAVERGEPLTDQTAPHVWASIVPKAPAWIDEIRRWGQAFGFVCYRSSEVEQRPTVARDRWLSVFEDAPSPGWPYTGSSNEFCGYRKGAHNTIMDGFVLGEYMNALWQPSCPVHGLPSEAQPSAFREHFKTVAASNLDSPRMSRNTFLVLHDDCVFPELDTYGLRFGEVGYGGYVTEDEIGEDGTPLLTYRDLPMFFVWAYDANWDPPNHPEDQAILIAKVKGCNCQGTFGRGYGGADEDGYQGRVKVRVHCLFTWLYYARHVRDNVIDLKDIWRIAQGMPNQVWDCGKDLYDQSQPTALP
ncbi:hypothetical protein CEP54_014963 [Fusarium duplospermum]|uniref:Uncharacterized protein n=1 Tax=Fusarium duplospermum TaxID=1325734 RepID=A0A428NSJ7_9HYPO|nr:hypothetical protein CEP54_014963 [Fusarium duplospermum]